MPAEIRLQTPQVVEVLARPEQDEGGPPLRLVDTGHCLANAGEQAPLAIGVSHVRRRYRAGVNEGVAEGDVPGA